MTRLNDQMQTAFTADAGIEDLGLDLRGGVVTIRNLKIHQPEGYGDKPLLHVPVVRITVDLTSLFSTTLEIKKVEAAEAILVLRRTEHGLNAAAVFAPRKERPRQKVLVREATIGRLRTSYHDVSFEESDFEIYQAELQAEVKDLFLGSLQSEDTPSTATVRIEGELLQAPFPPAYAGVYAEVGPVEDSIPRAVGIVRATGIVLDPFKSALSPGTIMIIGGRGMDFGVNLKVAPGYLDGNMYLITAAGGKYTSEISGTPEDAERKELGFWEKLVIWSRTKLANIGESDAVEDLGQGFSTPDNPRLREDVHQRWLYQWQEARQWVEDQPLPAPES